MSRCVQVAGLLIGLMLVECSPAFAALSVNPIFRSNMVLQTGMPVPVFGTATAGASVNVQFQNQNLSTVAAADGKWRIDLASMPSSTSASTMTVTSAGTTATYTGVQVGEVWLCSGQSNMGFPLTNANGGSQAIAESGSYNIRLFRMTGGNGPSTTSWQVASPSTTPNFTAAGWWFGRELYLKYGVPVGLIQATHDGTAIDQWEHSSGGVGTDYDAMVKSIQPFAIRGVTWYQGESNGGDSAYASKLTSMINEWRTDWGLSSLPFGIVQLAARSGWNVCRNAQLIVSQTVANCFLVVITDLPGGQLHPPEKKPVGIRLGIGARGKVYGEAIEYAGPIRDIANSFVSGNTVTLAWTHIGNGLFTQDGLAPGPFKVAAATGQFKAATAVIVGNTIQVSSSMVSNPKRVQYAYSSSGGNLRNSVSIVVEGGASTVDRLVASEFEFSFP